MLGKIKKILLGNSTQGVISKKEIAKYLPNNPIIIEAGASTGEDTVELAQQFPNGKIYAFEPLPHIYEIMNSKVKQFPNVKTFASALSDTTGKAKINISSKPGNSSSSLMNPKEHLKAHPEISFEESIEVPTITIDDFLKQENITAVDFLWLDMQGLEQRVLAASNQIFDSLKLLYTEVSLIETYEGVMLYPAYRKWLEAKGMEVVKEELPWEDMGNVLLKKK